MHASIHPLSVPFSICTSFKGETMDVCPSCPSYPRRPWLSFVIIRHQTLRPIVIMINHHASSMADLSSTRTHDIDMSAVPTPSHRSEIATRTPSADLATYIYFHMPGHDRAFPLLFSSLSMTPIRCTVLLCPFHPLPRPRHRTSQHRQYAASVQQLAIPPYP